MDAEGVFLIFAAVLILVLLILLTYFGVKYEKKDKKEHPETAEELLERELETQELHAKVVDLSCSILSQGYRHSRTFEEFTVTFEADDGEKYKFRVNEEMYHGFEKGQVGTLTITDGAFYGFNPD